MFVICVYLLQTGEFVHGVVIKKTHEIYMPSCPKQASPVKASIYPQDVLAFTGGACLRTIFLNITDSCPDG